MAKAKKEKPTIDLDNTVHLDVEHGRIVIQLLPELAPNHVARIKELIAMKFYDGIAFHRVIDGFMAQGGDPTGTGSGGSTLPNVKAEFTDKASFVRGMVGMARKPNPDSANSQFFIMLDAAPSLDGQYTIWGKVTSGMTVVDKIKKGRGASGTVEDPDKIVTMRMAADVSQAHGKAAKKK